MYRDLWRLMDGAGVDVLLVGHNHIYHRWAPQDAEGNRDANGIRQFTVGTADARSTRLGRSPVRRTSSPCRTRRSACCT